GGGGGGGGGIIAVGAMVEGALMFGGYEENPISVTVKAASNDVMKYVAYASWSYSHWSFAAFTTVWAIYMDGTIRKMDRTIETHRTGHPALVIGIHSDSVLLSAQLQLPVFTTNRLKISLLDTSST